MQELVIPTKSKPIVSFSDRLPAVLQYAGQDVIKAFATFFTDQIRNRNTREAYLRNATAFFDWCELQAPGLQRHRVLPHLRLC